MATGTGPIRSHCFPCKAHANTSTPPPCPSSHHLPQQPCIPFSRGTPLPAPTTCHHTMQGSCKAQSSRGTPINHTMGTPLPAGRHWGRAPAHTAPPPRPAPGWCPQSLANCTRHNTGRNTNSRPSAQPFPSRANSKLQRSNTLLVWPAPFCAFSVDTASHSVLTCHPDLSEKQVVHVT